MCDSTIKALVDYILQKLVSYLLEWRGPYSVPMKVSLLRKNVRDIVELAQVNPILD